jgi:hypothetical protein
MTGRADRTIEPVELPTEEQIEAACAAFAEVVGAEYRAGYDSIGIPGGENGYVERTVYRGDIASILAAALAIPPWRPIEDAAEVVRWDGPPVLLYNGEQVGQGMVTFGGRWLWSDHECPIVDPPPTDFMPLPPPPKRG